MRHKFTPNIAPTVDILIAIAAKGGVENCINMTGKYLTQKGFKVRVIQLIYLDFEWVDPCMEFHYLFHDRDTRNVQTFIDGYKAFLNEHEKPDLILSACWPMMSHVAKMAVTKLELDTIVASWLHAPVSQYEAAGYGGMDYLLKADLHFAISNEIASSIKRVSQDALIYRINNPVDMSRIHKVKEHGTRTLLFVGRISEEKNIPVILGALALTKTNWKLRLVGDGEAMPSIKKMAKDIKISDRVEFIGWSNDPWKYAEGSTALILSSLYEGSPLVAIEALSCGLPVIANTSSRVSEIIAPGENGYLYPNEDIHNLAKILDMIAADAFPPISSEACMESVSFFDSEKALFDFYVKLFVTANGRKMDESGILQEKISVIIPCYNAEKYIKRCLDSVLCQTIGKERLEIIAVNDATKDGTRHILSEYENQYPDNICLINLDENGGQGKARNLALNYASGQYIAYVDVDDCIPSDILENLYLIQKCYPVDVISSDFEMFSDEVPDDKGRILGECSLTTIDSDIEKRQLFINNAFITSPWGKLYKKDFLLNYDVHFPEAVKMEDIYFTYLVTSYARSWVHTASIGYYYYQNPEGTMRSEGIKKYYMDVFFIFKEATEKLKQTGFFYICSEEFAFVFAKKVFMPLFSFMKEIKDNNSHINKELLIRYLEENFPDINTNNYLEPSDKKLIQDYLSLKGTTDV